MEKIIRRAAEKIILRKSKRSPIDSEDYDKYVSRLLSKRNALAAAMREIERKLEPLDKPVVFLTPGTSGHAVGRLFLEYLREKERLTGMKYPRGRPTLLTLPVRVRRVYFEGDTPIPLGDYPTARFLYDNLRDSPLYRGVFERAKRGEIQLVYLDTYEHLGLTRRIYEQLAKLFGVPQESITSIVLSKSIDPAVWSASQVLESLSRRMSWKDTRREIKEWNGKRVRYERYVPKKKG